jgi:hypothetical protein
VEAADYARKSSRFNQRRTGVDQRVETVWRGSDKKGEWHLTREDEAAGPALPAMASGFFPNRLQRLPLDRIFPSALSRNTDERPVMAPRANWKGFLRLSLVTCPVALYPATSESEKISFNQLNRKTGHRIKYSKVDADTGEEVANEDIVKGYKVDTDTFVEVTKDELENVALESTRTIEIDEFVDRTEIDPRYLIRP